MIERFKRETVSLYKDSASEQSVPTNEFFQTGQIPAVDDEHGKLVQKNYFNVVIALMMTRNPQRPN
ncbi:hypothetical protein AB4Z22_21080 [Paenibacillus sp. TAF58]